MHHHVFCNLADTSRLLASKKEIMKSWSSQPKLKLTTCTCGYLGPGISKAPKKLRLFSHIKKRKLLIFHGKLHLWSNPVRKHLQKHKPWELIAQYAWNRPASLTFKWETQSGKIKFAQCRILHALHKLKCKKRARKTTAIPADSSLTLIALSKVQSPFSQAIYIYISRVWPVNI